MANNPKWLLIHHTSSSRVTNPNQFNATNNYHKKRGFPESKLGFHIGYHWEINAAGEAIRARGDNEIGAHCKEKSMNFKSIGIVLDGNFDIEEPTEEQKTQLYNLIKYYQQKYNIPDDHIRPHRYFATGEEKNDTLWKTATGKKPYKSCWGSKLPDDIIHYLKPISMQTWEQDIVNFVKSLEKTPNALLNDTDAFIASPTPYKVLVALVRSNPLLSQMYDQFLTKR